MSKSCMWDETSINYSGEGCLALPKLNLQFLTLHDYFLRNFNLIRLESTYEIREDIQEAVPHLLAHINNSQGETAFCGWSRMAVPINDFEIPQVKQPSIGEEKPSSVTAQGPEEADRATVPQRLMLQYEEGSLMNHLTGRVKRDKWKPTKGEMRTVTVASLYHIHVTDIAQKGSEDVYYTTFNVLMRRKPKKKSFKAILESSRDLMSEYCIVPEWFLWYGDPSAAQWPNMPNLLETVDFTDTFPDANHLSGSFPEYEVSFVHADGAEALDPRPPFRITLPKTLKGDAALSGDKISQVHPAENVNMVDPSPKEKLTVESTTIGSLLDHLHCTFYKGS